MSYLKPEMRKFINTYLLSKGVKTSPVSYEEFKGLDRLDIIKRYIALIILMSNKHTSHPLIERDDLVMEGIAGLLDAIERFDPTRNENFHFLAITLIRGKMYDYYLSNKNQVSVPRYISIVLSHLDVLRKLLSNHIQEPAEIQSILFEEKSPFEEKLPAGVKERTARVKEKIRKIGLTQANCDYKTMVEKAKEEFSFVPVESLCLLSDFSSSMSSNPEEACMARETLNRLAALIDASYEHEKVRKVAHMVLRGHSNAEIARETGLMRGQVNVIKNDFLKKVRASPQGEDLGYSF